MQINDFFPKLNSKTCFYGVSLNSQKIKKGDLFFTFNGNLDHTLEAIKNGCVAVFSPRPLKIDFEVHIIADIKETLAFLLSKISHFFLKNVILIGITGTDGKTTTTNILNQLLIENYNPISIGTNGIYTTDKHFKTKNTTIDIVQFYDLINLYHTNKNVYITEVSSEGILDKRILYLEYDFLIFTNLTHEHLNTHKNMENYYQTKKSFFKQNKTKHAKLINTDDYYGKRLFDELDGSKISFGIKTGMYQARNIRLNRFYSSFDLYFEDVFIETFTTSITTSYNIYNLLPAIITCLLLKVNISHIKKKLPELKFPKGRFNLYHNKKSFVIDFAHTPNSLLQLLLNLKHLYSKKLILVLGAQGEKDRTKRFLMGHYATKYASHVIFTSEDAKNEDLNHIIYDLIKDVYSQNYQIIYSRKQAIKEAFKIATSNDMVVICGKGFESYEINSNQKRRHNDYLCAKLFNT